MTNTRFDPEKRFKKAAGPGYPNNAVDSVTVPITPVTGISTYVKYVPYVLGVIVIGIVIWKLKKKK